MTRYYILLPLSAFFCTGVIVVILLQTSPGAPGGHWYWTLTCEKGECQSGKLNSLTVRSGAGIVDTYRTKFWCETAAKESAVKMYARARDQYSYSCSQLEYEPRRRTSP